MHIPGIRARIYLLIDAYPYTCVHAFTEVCLSFLNIFLQCIYKVKQNCNIVLELP